MATRSPYLWHFLDFHEPTIQLKEHLEITQTQTQPWNQVACILESKTWHCQQIPAWTCSRASWHAYSSLKPGAVRGLVLVPRQHEFAWNAWLKGQNGKEMTETPASSQKPKVYRYPMHTLLINVNPLLLKYVMSLLRLNLSLHNTTSAREIVDLHGQIRQNPTLKSYQIFTKTISPRVHIQIFFWHQSRRVQLATSGKPLAPTPFRGSSGFSTSKADPVDSL